MGDPFGAHRAPPPSADHGYLVATPDSRGLLGCDGAIGEDDVLRVLADVERTHAVDADRVYLTGPSMGGAGTWSPGLHYADLFAPWRRSVPRPRGECSTTARSTP